MHASQHRSPIPTFPKGKESHQTPLNTASRNSRPLGRDGEGLPSYNLSHTRRKPQHVAMSGRHWLRVITPLSDSELLWFPPRMTFQSPVCGPLGLV